MLFKKPTPMIDTNTMFRWKNGLCQFTQLDCFSISLCKSHSFHSYFHSVRASPFSFFFPFIAQVHGIYFLICIYCFCFVFKSQNASPAMTQYLGSGHLILAKGGWMGQFGELDFFGPRRGLIFFRQWKGGLNVVILHWQTSLINAIKKLFHEKKKNEYGYIKYELGGGVNCFYMLKELILFMCEGVVFHFSSPWPNISDTPRSPPVLNNPSLRSLSLSHCKTLLAGCSTTALHTGSQNCRWGSSLNTY